MRLDYELANRLARIARGLGRPEEEIVCEVVAGYRRHFGFRASLTRRRDANGKQRSRLWLPLFPDI